MVLWDRERGVKIANFETAALGLTGLKVFANFFDKFWLKFYALGTGADADPWVRRGKAEAFPSSR
jgi:hypothetical protein